MISEERILEMVEERNIVVPVPMPLLPWDCACRCGALFEAPAELGVDFVNCPKCGKEKDLRMINTTESLFGYWKGLNGMGYY